MLMHHIPPNRIHPRLQPIQHGVPDGVALQLLVVGSGSGVVLGPAGLVIPGVFAEDHGLDGDEDLQDGGFARLPGGTGPGA